MRFDDLRVLSSVSALVYYYFVCSELFGGFGRTLGQGAFGRVKLVQAVSMGTVYALKVLSKVHIQTENQAQHVLSEKEVRVIFCSSYTH